MKVAALWALVASTALAVTPDVELVARAPDNVATRVTNDLKPRQASSGDLPIVTMKGNAFFAGDDRFYIRGIAYQPGGAADPADPLLDIPALTRDIKHFKELGINTIRIYTVDNSATHAEGMKLLADAGIYLCLDLNTPGHSLNRQDNETLFLSYNEKYLQSVFATIDLFSGYSNMLMMINGNEVINERNNTIAAPYIKALQRDIKAYMSARKYRNIPVGYAAADVAENIDQQLAYFDCGPDGTRGDFFALNDYSWCDPSSFTISGWDKKVEKLKGYGAALVMAEFGCITNRRDWGEVASLFSSNMTGVYSGGLAYEYSVEPNGYGIVSIDNAGSIEPNADFDRLVTAFKKTPNPKGDGGYNPNPTASECPAFGEDWAVEDLLLPAMPEMAQDYFSKGAGKGPGIGKDVTPSQYGGESYSPGMIAMDGSAASSSNSNGNGNGNSNGNSNGGSSASNANSSSAASQLTGPQSLSVMALPMIVSAVGLFAGFGLGL
ncbi:1,3-beta-glucanosyltransferase gel1 precursor [Drepanopeziza brunnea f. sp. 'multigermtubi' MB_m1]|uniref:1,3-beta-glucanosyltransferase n=1 Tax=Marssonina brunnea f. sp. multigermtubi (strain MB_m1) TaxID=1072389 RepID=K1WUR8_MARBU|nr:1,3-beta-glucanosyltransferase gel1 precursor [Drepanopeziza brunnea f. sp. 'multigermtubi' MB_m1]EKD16142.1 1,3-beta-glucanosyltransferase gel1 precursor [Drepanopeziza brunnea f. sp. 'multigermtubi' MB_m1]